MRWSVGARSRCWSPAGGDADAASELAARGERLSQRGLVALLALRTAGFLAVQAAIAAWLNLGGVAGAWTAAAAWWPVAATVTNLGTVAVLVALLRREGLGYRDLFRVQRRELRTDLLVLIVLLAVAAPIAFFPSPVIATMLWNDPLAGSRAMIQPLPSWGAWVAIVGFPVSIAFAELPLYFGYVLPRMRSVRWVAVAACGFALAFQHIALPLLWDPRFLAWRLGMFLPFALLLGAALRWRPSLLPWLCIVHGLMDLSAGLVVWRVSNGMVL